MKCCIKCDREATHQEGVRATNSSATTIIDLCDYHFFTNDDVYKPNEQDAERRAEQALTRNL